MDISSTSRVEFVRNLEGSDSVFLLRGSLTSAFISCLAPEETCQLLDLDFHQEFTTRRLILRKIERDIGNHGFKECHYELVDRLVGVLGTLPYNKKNGCAGCLSYLYDYAPQDIRHRLLRFFLESKYVFLRRRGYRKLFFDWDASHENLITEVWNTRYDSDCAWLIIYRFPVEYLREHFDELLEQAVDTWHSTKLYLRVSEIDFSKAEYLAQTDEIRYAYVCAKLGRTFDADTALSMFERNKYDEELGLLIWCFGQMRLWSVLKTIEQDLDEEELWLERSRRIAEDFRISESR